MDLGRLGKKARNELLRNPKKSAILGVICLVALYFWLPLLRGWLPGGKKTVKGGAKTVATASKTPVAVDEPAEENTKSTARAEAAFRWNKLELLRKQDPRMSPAGLAIGQRNPFRLSAEMSQAMAAREEEEDKVEVPQPVEIPVVDYTPASLGLVLKGTLVGSRVRSANINDLTYVEGSQVKIRSASIDAKIEFTLTQVKSNSVVLTREGKSYTLEFRQESLPEGSEIVLGQVAQPVAGEVDELEPGSSP